MAESEDARLEQFLSRLGLVDLQILHLEQSLSRESDDAVRIERARHLADLYASQMITNTEDSERYGDLEQRIERLINQIPQANTPSLQVMMLQADYLRAEQLMGRWIASPSDTASRDAAAAILQKIAPQLDHLQEELHKRVNQLLDDIDLMDPSDERDSKENELRRVQSVTGRAAYFAAWSNYYLGRANPALPNVQEVLTHARDIFRQLLGLGDDYGEVEAQMLGLEMIYRARSLVGLALSEAAVGDLKKSLQCFQYLEHSSVPSEVRDQVPYWRTESLLAAGQWDAALEYVQDQVHQISGSPTQGKVSFCVHLVRSAYADPGTVPSKATELGMLGIAGLVKLHQLGIVRDLTKKYAIPLEGSNNFYLQWIRGQQLLEIAEKSKSAEDCSTAATQLEAALATPDAEQDRGAEAQCQYQLGWCYYHMQAYEKAARTYESAVTGLQASGNDTAVQAAWAAFLAYRKLANDEPRFVSSAIDVLTRIQREFPNHEYARRADYQIGKMREGAVPESQTRKRLESVPETSTDYVDARYDICVLLHKQWISSGNKEAAADRVFQAVDKYLAVAEGETDVSRLLKCCMLAVDVAASDPVRLRDRKQAYLNKAGSWAASPSVRKNVAAEYHYRCLREATGEGNPDQRRRHADWIVNHAPGSPYELPALVVSAQAIDREIAKTKDPIPIRLSEEAYQIYQRLADLLGSSQKTVAANKNARVANSKLAHYATLLGKHDVASTHLQAILAAFPTEKPYLRRAGLACHLAGKNQQALDYWRTLLAGLPKGSHEWYEAKYYQLACLFEVDAPRARTTLKQFQLLYPNPPEDWAGKIRQLENR